jgi:hypothetical protein
MIPLTLALSLQGRGDYNWFLPLAIIFIRGRLFFLLLR